MGTFLCHDGEYDLIFECDEIFRSILMNGKLLYNTIVRNYIVFLLLTGLFLSIVSGIFVLYLVDMVVIYVKYLEQNNVP